MVKIHVFSLKKHCLCVSVHTTNHNAINFYCDADLCSHTAAEAPPNWMIYKSCVLLVHPIQKKCIT